MPRIKLFLKPLNSPEMSISNPFLVIQCLENRTDFVVYFDELINLSQNDATITYRLDKQNPIRANWVKTRNSQGAGLWGGRDAIPFIKRLVQAERLAIRAGSDPGDKTLEFILTGLSEHLPKVRKACGW